MCHYQNPQNQPLCDLLTEIDDVDIAVTYACDHPFTRTKVWDTRRGMEYWEIDANLIRYDGISLD